MINKKLIKIIIRWLLFTLIILYLITGLGITEFRTVGTLTGGLLSKNLAFRIHDSLFIPFITLMILHIFLSPVTSLVLKLRGK